MKLIWGVKPLLSPKIYGFGFKCLRVCLIKLNVDICLIWLWKSLLSINIGYYFIEFKVSKVAMANQRKFRGIVQGFLNLFLQSPCCLCGRPAEISVCLYCHRQLEQSQSPQVSKKQNLLASSRMPVFVWGDYGGVLKRAIAVMKYENQPQLAKPLGEWVGEAWLKQGLVAERNLMVVPIPLHRKKLKARGFNQAELLAEYFCSVTRLPLCRQGLERIRETEAQFGLSAVQRQQNLRNAFSVGKGFPGRFSGSVLLFDDIYTTGATIDAAVEALGAAGVPVAGVVAVAAPPPRIKPL